jgi:hypothetical protein
MISNSGDFQESDDHGFDSVVSEEESNSNSDGWRSESEALSEDLDDQFAGLTMADEEELDIVNDDEELTRDDEFMLSLLKDVSGTLFLLLPLIC